MCPTLCGINYRYLDHSAVQNYLILNAMKYDIHVFWNRHIQMIMVRVWYDANWTFSNLNVLSHHFNCVNKISVSIYVIRKEFICVVASWYHHYSLTLTVLFFFITCVSTSYALFQISRWLQTEMHSIYKDLEKLFKVPSLRVHSNLLQLM